jgi:hypothetical protein
VTEAEARPQAAGSDEFTYARRIGLLSSGLKSLEKGFWGVRPDDELGALQTMIGLVLKHMVASYEAMNEALNAPGCLGRTADLLHQPRDLEKAYRPGDRTARPRRLQLLGCPGPRSGDRSGSPTGRCVA